jgi:hypothetical protein
MWLIKMILPSVFLFTLFQEIKAQDPPPPPRPVKIYTTSQKLSFGTFTYGVSGGTVTVSEAGSRSKSGDIILLGLGYASCMLLIEANPGTLISLIYNQVGPLTNGTGGSMALQIVGSSPISPFITNAEPPATTTLYIGGRLTVGNSIANPPGNYNGTFDIMFNQE